MFRKKFVLMGLALWVRCALCGGNEIGSSFNSTFNFLCDYADMLRSNSEMAMANDSSITALLKANRLLSESFDPSAENRLKHREDALSLYHQLFNVYVSDPGTFGLAGEIGKVVSYILDLQQQDLQQQELLKISQLHISGLPARRVSFSNPLVGGVSPSITKKPRRSSKKRKAIASRAEKRGHKGRKR